MNILYLAHRIPYPPNKGDKMRAFRQLQQLCQSHRVWCACFIDDPRDYRYVRELSRLCKGFEAIELRKIAARLSGLASLARGATITEGFYSSKPMRRLLAHWQKSVEFDAVVAFSSSMAPYALDVLIPRRILDLCDLDSQKWREYAKQIDAGRRLGVRDRLLRRLYHLESQRLFAAELRWTDLFDATLLATAAESAEMRGLAADRKIHVVGNGVDSPPRIMHKELPAPDLRPVVGFVGVMDYLPNVDAVQWFTAEVWPTIYHRFPGAEFRIVGRSPAPEVRSLGRHPGVHVIGEVVDVGSEVARFDVSVAPLRMARGIQNKVLEAMAAGKSVVLTPKAAHGVRAMPGRDYLVAGDAEQFAGAVVGLLSDNALRLRIGTAAREFVTHRFQWERELARFESIVTGELTGLSAREEIARRPISSPIQGVPLLPLETERVLEPSGPRCR